MILGKGISNVGSKASRYSMNKATNTSMGKSVDKTVIPRKKIHKGSSAGLRNEKPVHLEINGSGLLNPKNYKARYNKKRLTIPAVAGMNPGFTMRSNTTDTRALRTESGSIKLFKDRY